MAGSPQEETYKTLCGHIYYSPIYLFIDLIYLFILDGEVPLSVPRTIRTHQP